MSLILSIIILIVVDTLYRAWRQFHKRKAPWLYWISILLLVYILPEVPYLKMFIIGLSLGACSSRERRKTIIIVDMLWTALLITLVKLISNITSECQSVPYVLSSSGFVKDYLVGGEGI